MDFLLSWKVDKCDSWMQHFRTEISERPLYFKKGPILCLNSSSKVKQMYSASKKQLNQGDGFRFRTNKSQDL